MSPPLNVRVSQGSILSHLFSVYLQSPPGWSHLVSGIQMSGMCWWRPDFSLSLDPSSELRPSASSTVASGQEVCVRHVRHHQLNMSHSDPVTFLPIYSSQNLTHPSLIQWPRPTGLKSLSPPFLFYSISNAHENWFLPLKYIQNMTTSHPLHYYHPRLLPQPLRLLPLRCVPAPLLLLLMSFLPPPSVHSQEGRDSVTT